MNATSITFGLSKLIVLAIAAYAISGCATNFPSTPHHQVNVTVSSMEPEPKENPYFKEAVIPKFDLPANMKDEYGGITFEQALQFNKEVGFGSVQINFTDMNDKAIRHNPSFDQRWYDKLIHTNRTYTGQDFWGREYSADLITRMEYYLIRDARRVIAQPWHEGGTVFKHHKHSGPVMDIQRPTLPQNSRGMNNAMIWLKEIGATEEMVDTFAYYCMALPYSEMMAEMGLGEESLMHRAARFVYRHRKDNGKMRAGYKNKTLEEYVSYVTQGASRSSKYNDQEIKQIADIDILKRQENCESYKDTMIIDGAHVFYKKPPEKLENGVFETIRVDEVRLPPEFFQRLMSSNYFDELTRVSANGPFHSLRRPDGRNIVMQYDVRQTGMPWGQKEKIDVTMFGNNNDALKTAVLFDAWVGDRNFIHHYNVLDWSKQFNKSFPYTPASRGLFICRTNGQEMNFQLSTSTIRRAYDCTMNYIEGKSTNSFVRILKGPGTTGSLFATIDIEGGDFAGRGYANDMKEEFVNETLFEQNKPIMVDEYVEERLLSKTPVNTAVAYIQRLEDGKVEGVVHVLGYKVIYDLTDMSNWYRNKMKHVYPDDKPLMKWYDIHAAARNGAVQEFQQRTARTD